MRSESSFSTKYTSCSRISDWLYTRATTLVVSGSSSSTCIPCCELARYLVKRRTCSGSTCTQRTHMHTGTCMSARVQVRLQAQSNEELSTFMPCTSLSILSM